MPTYAIICHDRADAGPLRANTRPHHLDHLRAIAADIVAAGPIDDEAGVPVGSVIIARFDGLDDANAFAAADPYARAGLFARVEVRAWRQIFPQISG